MRVRVQSNGRVVRLPDPTIVPGPGEGPLPPEVPADIPEVHASAPAHAGEVSALQAQLREQTTPLSVLMGFFTMEGTDRGLRQSGYSISEEFQTLVNIVRSDAHPTVRMEAIDRLRTYMERSLVLTGGIQKLAATRTLTLPSGVAVTQEITATQLTDTPFRLSTEELLRQALDNDTIITLPREGEDNGQSAPQDRHTGPVEDAYVGDPEPGDAPGTVPGPDPDPEPEPEPGPGTDLRHRSTFHIPPSHESPFGGLSKPGSRIVRGPVPGGGPLCPPGRPVQGPGTPAGGHQAGPDRG